MYGSMPQYSGNTLLEEDIDLSFESVSYRVRRSVPTLDRVKALLSCQSQPVEDEKQVLTNVSGYLPAGSFLAILGPSGAGKRYRAFVGSDGCARVVLTTSLYVRRVSYAAHCWISLLHETRPAGSLDRFSTTDKRSCLTLPSAQYERHTMLA